MTCGLCHGAGSYQEAVRWSDGLGMAVIICRVCRGSGEVNPAELLAQLQRLDAAERDLSDLKVAAALYLALTTGDQRLPEPPLELAPRPAQHAAVWEKQLRTAAAELRRAG